MIRVGTALSVEAPYLGLSPGFPDETLFSLCSRLHRLSGHMLSSATCRSTFGHSRQGAQHDFPGRIGEFVRRTHGLFGCTPELVIRHHTLIRFYLPWRSAIDVQNAISAMTAGGMGNLKMHLGLPSSRLRAHHPLKFCQACMRVDREKHGIAYWHLEHQFPGVWVCIAHGCGLHESDVKTSGVDRFLWHFPNIRQAYPPFERLKPGLKAVELIRTLSLLISRASNVLTGMHFDYTRLFRVYRQALREQGLITDTDRIALRQVCDRYQECTAELAMIEELRALHQGKVAVETHLYRMLRGPRPETHPLRHLVFILVFFKDWDAFLQAYRGHEESRVVHVDRVTRHSLIKNGDILLNGKREQVIQLMKEQHYSATKAADQVGVDRHTAISWATKDGLRTSTRSQRPADVRAAMIGALQCGDDCKQIANRFAVSPQVIGRLLRSEVGLHGAWRSARLEKVRASARDLWESARKRSPSLGVKGIRLIEPAVYAWLYRNDTAWLDEHKAAKSPAVVRKRNPVDWGARDEKFARAVREAILALQLESPQRRLTVQRIYQKLPALKAKLWALEKLPLTQMILGSVQPARSRSQANQIYFPFTD